MIPRRRHRHLCLPMRERELKTIFNAISVPIRVVNLDRPIRNRKEAGDGAAVVLDNFNEWDGLTSVRGGRRLPKAVPARAVPKIETGNQGSGMRSRVGWFGDVGARRG